VAWAILDTGVYVAHWEGSLSSEALADIRRAFIIRHSAVVLSELRRGTHTPRAVKLVDELHRLAKHCWEPTLKDWWDAGLLIRSIGDAEHWEISKRREFQNDALIALTARRHGAAVVTLNHRDFGLLAKSLTIQILAIPTVTAGRARQR